jgi:hypothetical protein
MKKLLIIAFMLIQISTIAQQHIFILPPLCVHDGHDWGRWVNGTEDIEIENGSVGYWIQSYTTGNSIPNLTIFCSYSGKTENMYVYTITKIGTSKGSATFVEDIGLIKSTTKLSLMASGKPGVLNCLLLGQGYAYDCH